MPRYWQIFLAAFCVLFVWGAIQGFVDKKHERHIEELVRDNIRFADGFIFFTCGDLDSIIRYDVDQNTFAVSPIAEYKVIYTSTPSINLVLPLTHDLAVLVATIAVGSGYSLKSMVDTFSSPKPKVSFFRHLKIISNVVMGAVTGYSMGAYIASLFPLLCDYNSVVEYFERNKNRIEHFTYIVSQHAVYECAQQLDADIVLLLALKTESPLGIENAVEMIRRSMANPLESLVKMSDRISDMKYEGLANNLSHGIYERNRERGEALESLYVQNEQDFERRDFVSAETELDTCLWQQAQVLSYVPQEMNETHWTDSGELEDEFEQKSRLERFKTLDRSRANLLNSWRASSSVRWSDTLR